MECPRGFPQSPRRSSRVPTIPLVRQLSRRRREDAPHLEQADVARAVIKVVTHSVKHSGRRSDASVSPFDNRIVESNELRCAVSLKKVWKRSNRSSCAAGIKLKLIASSNPAAAACAAPRAGDRRPDGTRRRRLRPAILRRFFRNRSGGHLFDQILFRSMSTRHVGETNATDEGCSLRLLTCDLHLRRNRAPVRCASFLNRDVKSGQSFDSGEA